MYFVYHLQHRDLGPSFSALYRVRSQIQQRQIFIQKRSERQIRYV